MNEKINLYKREEDGVIKLDKVAPLLSVLAHSGASSTSGAQMSTTEAEGITNLPGVGGGLDCETGPLCWLGEQLEALPAKRTER